MKVGFAGSAPFSVPFLKTLVESKTIEVKWVLTSPDQPAGRGRRMTPNALKQAAEAYGIECFTPDRLRVKEVREIFEQKRDQEGLKLMVVVAYGLIIPRALLSLFPLGWLNLHASLLPRWRGAAPIPRSIQAGDRVTGISLMRITPGLDQGAYASQLACEISQEETTGSLEAKLATLGSPALLALLNQLAHQEAVQWTEQEEWGVTYAHKLLKEEGCIDWAKPAALLEREVRAFNPWPASWFRDQGQRFRVWEAKAIEENKAVRPGTVVASGDRLQVQTGEGSLNLLQLQKEGGKRLPWNLCNKGAPFRYWTAGYHFEPC